MREVAVKKIGTTPLWMGMLSLEERRWSVGDLQQKITEYVQASGNTVTSALLLAKHELLLMNWPETRDEYIDQDVATCTQVLDDLAKVLNAEVDGEYTLTSGDISCVMGLKVGGYDDGRIATLSEINRYSEQLSMEPAHMISVRATRDGDVQGYDEPVVFLTGKDEAESTVHAIGDQLEQHHYAIQRGSGVTDLYETKWANQKE